MKKLVIGSLVCLLIMITCSETDTQPPELHITNPHEGDVETGTIRLQVSASDNKGVQSVSIYLDNEHVLATDVSPYYYDWNSDSIQQDSSQHTVFATAVDVNDNEAFSDTVSFNSCKSSSLLGGTTEATTSSGFA